jgi:leucyl aminopeptidase
MMDGTWVEMLNSDAEGRMILADALHYAKRLHPELVLEFSTLTGAAANAIGHYAMVGMGEVSPEQRNKIFQSAERTGERIAEFPFWDDYDELLKSDIADCKNIGGPIAGAITAGRFLKKFTDYPYYHFDIAGPAFIQKPFHYMPAGGTGFGIRFLMDFIENY